MFEWASAMASKGAKFLIREDTDSMTPTPAAWALARTAGNLSARLG
jgi:hypothetical protein